MKGQWERFDTGMGHAIQYDKNRICRIDYDAKTTWVSAKETADLIVKAVNCHDELVNTLKEVKSLIQSELDAHGDSDILNDAKKVIIQALTKVQSIVT